MATFNAKKAVLARSRADLKRGEELAPVGGISKEELDGRRQTVKVDEAAVEEALQTVYAIRVSLGLPAQPDKGDDLAEVPAGLDQNLAGADKTEEFEYTVEGQTKKGTRRVRTLDLGGGVTMEFVRIPHGTFLMGSPDSDKDAQDNEKPQHEVTITKDFYLGKFLVTKKQFARFLEAKGGYETEAEADGKGGWGFDGADFKQDKKFSWRDPGFAQTDDHPVVNVTWKDAKAFCEWAASATKQGVSLPSEAQWEYACRAGTRTRYCTGNAAESLRGSANIADQSAKAKFPVSATADFDDGYVFTSPVARFRPNPFGLYDMTGNVCQWCSDYCDLSLSGYENADKVDPENVKASDGSVVRGGSFSSPPKLCRVASRTRFPLAGRGVWVGFRVCVHLD